MISIGTEKILEEAKKQYAQRAEINLITAMLKDLLNRQPTKEDFIACTQKFSDPYDGTYVVYYNKIEIGTVRRIVEKEKFRVEFYPVTQH